MKGQYNNISNNVDDFAIRFGKKLDGSLYKSGIVGGHNPSVYSLSPVIWNAYWKNLGVNAIFLAYDVPIDTDHKNFLRFLEEAMNDKSVIELTITDPYKKTAYKEIEKIGLIDETAQRVGNVNTIIKSENIVGYNTDWIGFRESIRSVDVAGKTILLEGIGGAGNAAAHGVVDILDNGIIYLYNRTVFRDEKFVAGELARELKKYTPASVIPLGNELDKEKLDETDKAGILSEVLPDVDIYINATNQQIPLNPELLSMLPKHVVLFDTKYADKQIFEWQDLITQSGRIFIDGKGMLFYQFVEAARNVHLPEIDEDQRRKALESAAHSIGFKV